MRTTAALAIALALAGCDRLADPEEAPALATIQGTLIRGSVMSIDDTRLRVALIWYGRLSLLESDQNEYAVAQEVAIEPGLSTFQLDLHTLPPPEALIDQAELPRELAVWWPEGSQTAMGTLLAYEDLNDNGRLDLVEHDATELPDRVVAVNPDLMIGFAAGGVPAIPIAFGTPHLGYNLLRMPSCHVPGVGLPQGELPCTDSILFLDDDTVVELPLSEAPRLNALMCRRGGPEPVLVPGMGPVPSPDQCLEDGSVAIVARCASHQSLCWGNYLRCEHEVWPADASVDVASWPCILPDARCAPEAIVNRCESEAGGRLLAEGRTVPGWPVMDAETLYWADNGVDVASVPLAGGEPTAIGRIVDIREPVLLGSHLYALEFGWPHVARFPRAGGDKEIVANFPAMPGHGGSAWAWLATDGQQLFLANYPGGEIARVSAEQGYEALYSGEDRPNGLAVHDGWLYWVTSTPLAVRRASLVGMGTPETVATYTHEVEQAWPRLAGVAGGFVWWFVTNDREQALFRSPVEGGVAELMFTGHGIRQVTAAEGALYWSDATGTIWRFVEGGSPEAIIRGPHGDVWFAIHSGRIGWTRPHKGTVWVADLP